MPTNPVSASKLSVRGKAGGKHWTRAEVEARQAAADGLKRKHRVSLRVPAWLGSEAREVWARIRRQVKGLELLDNLDGDMLAVYCDAVVKHREASKDLSSLSSDEAIKSVQAWARIVAAYADKLGFTPAARVKKGLEAMVAWLEEESNG